MLGIYLRCECGACGHGLDYHNIGPVAQIPELVEFNIGFSIISRALFVGIKDAVREMIETISRHKRLLER